MELLKLEYFIATARESSMQTAADLLHLTQSPLSTAVKDPEAEMGVKLFSKAAGSLR